AIDAIYRGQRRSPVAVSLRSLASLRPGCNWSNTRAELSKPALEKPPPIARLRPYVRASSRMSPHPTDQRYFERQIVYARPIIIFLAILALFEQAPSREVRRSVSFLVAYLILALLVVRLERALRNRAWHLPLACDILALAFFLYLCPSYVH